LKKSEIDMYNQSPFLIIRSAYLYYILNQSQSQIADELNISITTVSRLLSKAKNEDIIRFVIPTAYLRCIELSRNLQKRFYLKNVIVAPPSNPEITDFSQIPPDEAKNTVALEGARYLQRIIKPEDILGVGWGSTVFQMINLLNPSQKVDAKFVTLHGSIEFIENELDVRTLVTRMAKAFFGKNYAFLTDALMPTPEAAEIMKHQRNNKLVIDMFSKITVAVFGIGSLYPRETSVLCSPEFMSREDLDALRKADVRGDIALRFLDRDGRECPTSLMDRMISIDLALLKKIPQKICLASGSEKAWSIVAALRGGLIDTLIIDCALAEALMHIEN
jgi:DNA-binding transcriptional regulator LsrR (DeoR family)